MSEQTSDLSAAEKAQISANLCLTRQFIQELIDHSERGERLPDVATVVLLPPDEAENPELTIANVRLADQLAAAGADPLVWKVGVSSTIGSREIARSAFTREE